MTFPITQVSLFNAELGELESAELWHTITERQLVDWEKRWVPELLEAMQRLELAQIEHQHWPQSSHWNWRKKVEPLQGMLANPCFSIICGKITQGMMIVDAARKRCRIDSQKGKHLVYVEYIENAPWNRSELFERPHYRGVGSVLIAASIELSENLEFHGRIGLHSLPQATNFYASTCGMTDLGADPDYDNLQYFEMTPEQARSFIKKGRQ